MLDEVPPTQPKKRIRAILETSYVTWKQAFIGLGVAIPILGAASWAVVGEARAQAAEKVKETKAEIIDFKVEQKINVQELRQDVRDMKAEIEKRQENTDKKLDKVLEHLIKR